MVKKKLFLPNKWFKIVQQTRIKTKINLKIKIQYNNSKHKI